MEILPGMDNPINLPFDYGLLCRLYDLEYKQYTNHRSRIVWHIYDAQCGICGHIEIVAHSTISNSSIYHDHCWINICIYAINNIVQFHFAVERSIVFCLQSSIDFMHILGIKYIDLRCSSPARLHDYRIENVQHQSQTN